MGTFAPQSVYSNTPSPQTGAGLAALASNLEAVKELPGAQPPQNIEISDNALTFSATPVSAFLIVDTEGQAAADDLEVINPVVSATDNLHDGMLLYLQAADAGRVVTVKNSSSANGIQTVGGGNITLTTNTWYILQLRSGTWYEISSTQAQTIDGVEFNGTAGITHATTCDTAAATAAKTATLDGFALIAGAEVTVKFTNGNTASNPTLNISNTGAAPILYQGVAITDASIGANTVCRLYYDGTAWNIVGIVTAPATTSSLGTARLATQAEVQAGAVASGSLSPAVLRPEDIAFFPAVLGPLMGAYNHWERITVSGSWTVPAGVNNLMLIAKGGGGSGSTAFATNVNDSGAGGGEGGTSLAFLDVTPGQLLTIVIGAGGSAVPNGGSRVNGNNGGNTTVTYNGNSVVTAGGGYGGVAGSGGNTGIRGGRGGYGNLCTGASGGVASHGYGGPAAGGTGGGSGSGEGLWGFSGEGGDGVNGGGGSGGTGGSGAGWTRSGSGGAGYVDIFYRA